MSGEEITVYSTKPLRAKRSFPENALNIVFEDEDILIINKPVGLVVHPASVNPNGTLINGVCFHHLQQQQNKDTLPIRCPVSDWYTVLIKVPAA